MPQPRPAAPSRQAREIDLPAWAERVFARPPAQFAWFLAFALLTRASTFGDPNYHNDELLYFLIGQRMHDGLLPYVDIWDRKGPVLFLIYWLIASISRSVVAYQLAACLFAATTAFIIGHIAANIAPRIGAMLAGTFYLVMLPVFAGGGGQAPVFYNLFVALAALAAFARTPSGGPTAWLAMAGVGLAIACKQTAALEGAFLGCVLLWRLYLTGQPPARLALTATGMLLAGAAPMAIFAAGYAALGHFGEFWHALVTSNLTKAYDPDGDAAKRIAALAIIASPLALPALATLALASTAPRAPLAGWLLAALAGVATVPNYIDHYMLPVLLPLALAAAPALGWRTIGPAYGLFAILIALMAGPALHFAERQASRDAMAAIVADIRARDPAPRLFVYQGPVYLYALLDSYPPTPLLFPIHLFGAPERNTSHLDTAAEVRRVLAWRPTVLVRSHAYPPDRRNQETGQMVDTYALGCRLWFTRTIYDYYGPQRIDVLGNCATGR